MVEYRYDALGKVLSVTGSMAGTVGQANPFRYRGYYWDSCSGLYYLQSRYYDPVVGRFINADSQINESILGINLFGYCENNPINYYDPHGNAPWHILPFMGFIHNIVQDYYVALYGFRKEFYTKKGGFIDLYMPGTAKTPGFGWEVKSFGTRYSLALAQLSICILQMGVKKMTYGFRLRELNIDLGLIWIRTYSYPLGIIYYSWGLTKLGLGLLALSPVIAKERISSTIRDFFKRVFGGCRGGAGVNGNPSTCFTADTLIQTSDGAIPISDIRAGDLVFSRDSENGNQEYKKVIQTYIRETNEMVIIVVDGHVIRTTFEHPFYVTNIGWVPAGKLTNENELLLSSGNSSIVESVDLIMLDEPVTVYNFEVEEFHTYFVSDLKILVHNKCS